MSVPPHDRPPPRPDAGGTDGTDGTDRIDDRGAGATDGDHLARAAARIGAAQRWLVDELRDECSDIGVSARGFDLESFLEGVTVFAREAARLGAPPERMLVLLKQCLADDAIALSDRDQYRLYQDRAVSAAVRAYFTVSAGVRGAAAEPTPPAR